MFLITDYEEKFPIFLATDLESVERMLNEYMGFGKSPTVTFVGFSEYQCKFPDKYEGFY